MKYLQKSFSVGGYSNYKNEHCEICGKESNYYVQTSEGKFCMSCYQNLKQQKAEEKIKTVIKESSGGL